MLLPVRRPRFRGSLAPFSAFAPSFLLFIADRPPCELDSITPLTPSGSPRLDDALDDASGATISVASLSGTSCSALALCIWFKAAPYLRNWLFDLARTPLFPSALHRIGSSIFALLSQLGLSSMT